VIAGVLGWALPAAGAEGDLDPTFGGDGTVEATRDPIEIHYGEGLTQQADGKLVMMGYVPEGDRLQVGVARFDNDGTLDGAFGDNGWVLLPDLGHLIGDVAMDGDKIVVATSASRAGASDFAAARLNADGSLDPQFGTAGIAQIDLGGDDVASAVVVDRVTHGLTLGGASDDALAFARLTSAGALDSNFDEDGRFVDADGVGPALALVIAPDGDILVTLGDALGVARYDVGGQVGRDPAFGVDGRTVAPIVSEGDTAFTSDLLLQPDGSIVAAGVSKQPALARFTASGQLDPTFGSGGTTLPDERFGWGWRVRRQTDGKLVVGAVGSGVDPGDFVVGRFSVDGEADLTFGTGGVATTNFHSDSENSAVWDLVIEADGQLILGGSINPSDGQPTFAMARYNATTGPPPPPPTTTTTTVAPTTTTTTPPPPPFVASRPAVRRGFQWHMRDKLSSGAGTESVIGFGDAGDQALLCDWNGDGVRTPGVRRGNVFYLSSSRGSPTADNAFAFGDPGDVGVCGDWDGDGDETVGVVRSNVWYLTNQNSPGVVDGFAFGDPGDVPVVGDWDGDGDANPGVRRGMRWFLRRTNATGTADVAPVDFGDPGDVPVVGDWDGDGDTTLGVFRNGVWFIRQSNDSGIGTSSFGFGDAGDAPLTWSVSA
jgi:uncharacterized delta-60 repeat protein